MFSAATTNRMIRKFANQENEHITYTTKEDDNTLNFDVLDQENETEENTTYTDNTFQQLAVDVMEDEQLLRIVCPLPGITYNDISLTIENDTLTITGEAVPPFADDNEIQYHIKEVHWGEYTRSIILPQDIQKNKIKARYVNGILVIDIPKNNSKSKAKSIKIELTK